MKTHMTQTCLVLLTFFLNGVLAGDWSVNIPSNSICAVIGSSVVLPCSYDFPEGRDGQQFKVMSEMWCIGDSRCITERNVYHSSGIFQDPSFQSRVEYLGNPRLKNCSIKISALKPSDSGTYVFYIITNHTTEKMPAQRGLQLLVGSPSAVTVLAGPSSDITEGESVSLSCCSPGPSSEAHFKWYKSSSTIPLHIGPVWTINQTSSKNSGSYYCQVQTRDKVQNSTELVLNVQYAPQNTDISSTSETELKTTLVCMSNANPPVMTYSWYEGAACELKADTSVYKPLKSNALRTSVLDQTISIINLRPEHSEVHCCVARNRHGSEKSTIKLKSASETSNSGGKMILLGVTIAVLLAIIAIVAFIMIRRKNSSRNHSYALTQTTAPVF